jgi:hypothetical protein
MAKIEKAEVMRKAWATYRRFLSLGQGKAGAALRQAWADVRQSAVFAGIIAGFKKAADLAPAAPRVGRPVWVGPRSLRARSFAW